MRTYQRKILLINKAFQWRMALYICSWVVALSFIYPVIVHNLFDFFIRYAEIDPAGPKLSFLKGARQDILVLLLMLQGTYFLLTLFVSLFLAHRVAGPIHKLKALFRKVKAGDLSDDLRLRKYDHFKDLAFEYNEMVEALRKRVTATVVAVEAAKQNSNEEGKKQLEQALKVLAGLPIE